MSVILPRQSIQALTPGIKRRGKTFGYVYNLLWYLAYHFYVFGSICYDKVSCNAFFNTSESSMLFEGCFTSIIPPVCYCKKLWVYPFSWPRFETMNEHSFIDDLIQFLKIYTKLYGTPCNKEIVNLKEHHWRSI